MEGVSRAHEPGLRRILVAYTANELGTWFGYVALAVGVYGHTQSALATAGLFVSAALFPALLVPPLVARIEVSSHRAVLSGLYAIEGLVAVALALLLWNFSLPAVLLLAAVDGTAALAARALLRAAVARAGADTGDHELVRRKANAAINIAWTTTSAVGPAVAGVAVAALGGPTALLIDAGSFLVCAGLLLGLSVYAGEIVETSMRHRLAVAWRYVRDAPTLRRLLLTQALALVFFASVVPVEVVFAKATLRAGDSGFGLMMGAWGVGMVLGGAVFAKTVKLALGPLLVAGALAVGLAYLGTAAAGSLAVACACAVVGGAGNGLEWPALISAVQQLAPKELYGRLMGAVESMGALCPVAGFALGGTLTALTSPRLALLVAGISSTAISMAFLRMCAPGLPLARVRRNALSGSEAGAATS